MMGAFKHSRLNAKERTELETGWFLYLNHEDLKEYWSPIAGFDWGLKVNSNLGYLCPPNKLKPTVDWLMQRAAINGLRLIGTGKEADRTIELETLEDWNKHF